MRGVLLAYGLLVGGLCLARDPFTSLENAAGYIVVEKGGKIQRYLVIEGKCLPKDNRQGAQDDKKVKEHECGSVIVEPVDTIPQQLRGGR